RSGRGDANRARPTPLVHERHDRDALDAFVRGENSAGFVLVRGLDAELRPPWRAANRAFHVRPRRVSAWARAPTLPVDRGRRGPGAGRVREADGVADTSRRARAG